jgi:hypothetical protein
VPTDSWLKHFQLTLPFLKIGDPSFGEVIARSLFFQEAGHESDDIQSQYE